MKTDRDATVNRLLSLHYVPNGLKFDRVLLYLHQECEQNFRKIIIVLLAQPVSAHKSSKCNILKCKCNAVESNKILNIFL